MKVQRQYLLLGLLAVALWVDGNDLRASGPAAPSPAGLRLVYPLALQYRQQALEQINEAQDLVNDLSAAPSPPPPGKYGNRGRLPGRNRSPGTFVIPSCLFGAEKHCLRAAPARMRALAVAAVRMRREGGPGRRSARAIKF